MEYLPDFKLHRPKTVEEAVALAAAHDGARFLAGGTDLVVNIRRGIEAPSDVVDLTAIDDFADIAEEDGGVSIGAGITLARLAAHPAIGQRFPAVAEAARAVAGPTHQRYGTLGGNLCLDTRCIFYNQSEWWRKSNAYCLKHRGEICHVAPGGKRCFAAFSGDVAPALLVHEAEATIAGPSGLRRVPLAELYKNDGMDHLALGRGEMVATVHLPRPVEEARSTYGKSRVRGSIDFPLCGAAVLLAMDDGKVARLSVALTSVSPMPIVIKNLDAFVGAPLDDDRLGELREIVRKQARPMGTTTIKPWYRRRAVGALAAKLARRLAAGPSNVG